MQIYEAIGCAQAMVKELAVQADALARENAALKEQVKALTAEVAKLKGSAAPDAPGSPAGRVAARQGGGNGAGKQAAPLAETKRDG